MGLTSVRCWVSYLSALFGERALRSSVTALTAALTTGGASGAARTAPVRRLRPCTKARGTETGWRALPARRRWLLLDVDGRARDGGPAAALGAISRRQTAVRSCSGKHGPLEVGR
jgi:hypothetical protein|uniref:Uncharacterized protein n=1 Tax=Zea mays TaxID=4577 RepID=B8A3H0_MAIZE|nr:unknown [Zea mays]